MLVVSERSLLQRGRINASWREYLDDEQRSDDETTKDDAERTASARAGRAETERSVSEPRTPQLTATHHRPASQQTYYLWSPYVIGQNIRFLPCYFYLLSIFFYSSPNLSGRRLDVYHTLTHGVALARI